MTPPHVVRVGQVIFEFVGRHGVGANTCVLPRPGWGLAQGRPAQELVRERTLDGSGTVRTEIEEPESLDRSDADARWSAWTCATLAYLAGLTSAALASAVEHARSREQFGRPLAAIPAVQARLADAKLA